MQVRSPDAGAKQRNPGPVAAEKSPDDQPTAVEKRPGLRPASGLQIAGASAFDDAPRSVSAPARHRAESTDKKTVAATDASDETALTTLYAQSAQLEALLAQVQDDRVVTGPAAAMAGELEARVADIDASLSQPGLAARQRAALWRDRVDALQQLAGFHSTQRLLAADGERYDGQLVAVY